jgi:hypothetical protein
MEQGAFNFCDSLSVPVCIGGAQVLCRLQFGVVKSGERADQLMSPNRVVGGNADKRKKSCLPCHVGRYIILLKPYISHYLFDSLPFCNQKCLVG